MAGPLWGLQRTKHGRMAGLSQQNGWSGGGQLLGGPHLMRLSLLIADSATRLRIRSYGFSR
jgi:hypothetical protein